MLAGSHWESVYCRRRDRRWSRWWPRESGSSHTAWSYRDSRQGTARTVGPTEISGSPAAWQSPSIPLGSTTDNRRNHIYTGMQTVIYMCYCKFLILNARNLYLRKIVTSTSRRLKFKILLLFFESGELKEIGIKVLYLQFIFLHFDTKQRDSNIQYLHKIRNLQYIDHAYGFFINNLKTLHCNL